MPFSTADWLCRTTSVLGSPLLYSGCAVTVFFTLYISHLCVIVPVYVCVCVCVCRLSYAEAMAAIAAKQHAMTSSLRYVTWLVSNPTYLNLNQQGGGGGEGSIYCGLVKVMRPTHCGDLLDVGLP